MRFSPAGNSERTTENGVNKARFNLTSPILHSVIRYDSGKLRLITQISKQFLL